MKTYRVTWTIDVEAIDPVEAAKHAKAIQVRQDSIANVFEVVDMSAGPDNEYAFEVDLDLLEE